MCLRKEVTRVNNISHIKVNTLAISHKFSDFLRNNSLFMQKNRAFKNIIHDENLFRQLISNFSNFQRNNSVFMQNKKEKK